MTAADIGPEAIERWALDYLGRYASSAENLRRVLLRRVRRRRPLDPTALAEIAAAIERLVARYCETGLVDDAAYAEGRARTLHRRGAPARLIRARLVEKGVAPPVAAAALEKLGATATDLDLAAACAFARRRRLGPYRRGAAAPQRELAAFARAGFSRRAAEAVLACADPAAVEELACSTGI